MRKNLNDYYFKKLTEYAFIPCDSPSNLPATGSCFKLKPEIGQGYYWIYSSSSNYIIKIHSFSLTDDLVLDMAMPECLSVTYYTSISGEELTPYRRLKNNVVKSFLGGYKPYKALIHKNIPIYSIGIEYYPDYYETHLNEQYSETYKNPKSAFKCIDETSSFTEMVYLLNQIINYRGEGVSASLFYDAKAAEALSLIFERHRLLNERKEAPISQDDKEMLQIVASYIGNHFADRLSIEQLSKIACMGSTKLKKCFKIFSGNTINEYIQNVRIGQAEQLLAYTDLTIGQVAEAVGYSNAGRFAELFREMNGILPLEFRKISHTKI